jgi:class 3 adenylate cyclase/Tfp pilus assembly protein PilF
VTRSESLQGAPGAIFERVTVVVRAGVASGIATFAFTDIEGSTARWERDRAAMQEAMRRHDAIVRGAIEQGGGRVFKTVGDAFLSAFARPEDAVAAMLAAQRALTVEDFSAVDGLRVRAAIHTGTAEEREGDYFGPAVNKVARLLAIGHGGQVLLTAETATLLGAALPKDASLRELGAYHLKDFSEPQRVFQLLAPELPAEFPPLRSLGTLPSDLSVIDAAEFHSVPSFGGRDDELAAVGAALQRDNAVAVVYGLGGVGKSSIAREYGWRNRDRYSVLWWLNAQTEAGIIDGLLRLGTMFEQGLDKLADRRVAAQRVINSVLGGFDKPALLVFDNLEDEALMRSWLPRTGARALATSRDTALSSDIVAIPLHIWSVEAAIAYLRRASGRNDLTEEDARAIAETLGALPLALSHAAATLRNLRMITPQRYLENIKEHLRRAPRGSDYPLSVSATFSTAIEHVEQQAAGAAAVLCFAACFGPDAIPDELFRQSIVCYAEGLQPAIVGRTALDLRSALAQELQLDEALGALDRLSLLTFAPGAATYSMHRLVQLAARDLAGETLRWRECAVVVANAAFPKDKFSAWPQCARLAPHVHVALGALPESTDLAAAADLAGQCAIYLHRRGDNASAERLETRALAIRERVPGHDSFDVAKSCYHLGRLNTESGRYEAALAFLRRSLAIREKLFGPEAVENANPLDGLAGVYQELGHYDEARRLFARAVLILEKADGSKHTLATTINNLATLDCLEKRYHEAATGFRRATEMLERYHGPDHPDVGIGLRNLADVYLKQERCDEAEPLIMRALTIWEKALGPDHPQYTDALEGLAELNQRRGRYDEAEQLYHRSLAVREKAEDVPRIAATLGTLGRFYVDRERYEEAAPLFARALAIQENTLGPNNVATIATGEALKALRSKR